MTIPEQAVQAAILAYQEEAKKEINHFPVMMRAALAAAIPFLPVQGAVKKLEWQEPNKATNGCWTAECAFGTYSAVNDGGWYVMLDDHPRGKGFEWGGSDLSKDTRQTAFDAAQADYEARILSALEPSVCKTCKGRGIIGGMYRVGDGDVDGWEEPCPDCGPSAAREPALEEHLHAIEQQLAVNLGYFHDEKRFLLETLQAHITTRIAAIRALSSPDHADDLKAQLEKANRKIADLNEMVLRYGVRAETAEAELKRIRPEVEAK